MCAFISIITHFRLVIMWTFYNIKVCCAVLGPVGLFVIPQGVTCQTPPSMRFSRQEYWSGFPFPSPGDLPNPEIEPRFPALRQTPCHLSHQGSPSIAVFVAVVQSLSHVPLFVGLHTAACQAPLSSTLSQSLLKFMSIELVMLSSHLILGCPLLLPSIFSQHQGLFQ